MALTLPAGETLVCATHNPGKAREIAALLDDRFHVLSAADLGLPEPEEIEQTFVGNAVLKARAAALTSGRIAIADDSGLDVAALGGRPGVLSARWAEQADGKRDFGFAMARIGRELEGLVDTDSAARFVCALAVAWPNGVAVVVEGEVRGAVSFPPRGRLGFGYDPIFVPTGRRETFGEMAPEAKHAISHRADAFAKLKAALF